MTVQTLRAQSLKDLTSLARKRGVARLAWHEKRSTGACPDARHDKTKLARFQIEFEEIGAGQSVSFGQTTRLVQPHGAAGTQRFISLVRTVQPNHFRPRRRHQRQKTQISKRLEQAKVRLMRAKILSTQSLDGRSGTAAKDRLVVMVRGPYWLHAYWELTPAGIVRAQAALGEQWHAAVPMLRLIKVSTHGSSTAAERLVRDIPIHGGVTNWYIDVNGSAANLSAGNRLSGGRRPVLLAGPQQHRRHTGL